MSLTDIPTLLGQALQAIIPAVQWLSALLGALAYWACPPKLRLRAILPISLLVITLGYQRWPIISILMLAIGAGVYRATPWCIRRFAQARIMVGLITALFCGLHGLLGLLTFTDQLAGTGVTKELAIAQCGTVVLYGYLRLIHWTVDAQRAALASPDTQAPHNESLWMFLAWLMFFPTFTSLPLIRIQQFATLQNSTLGRRHVVRALKHAGQILLKSLVIAGLFTQVPQVQAIYHPAQFSVFDVWIGVLVNTVIFFLGFTTYVDFAIFSGCILGFDVPDNFARVDKLLTNARARDFWRDWNYTVTRWLQEYVYAPLGGVRAHPLRNTMLTMIFCGLWHSVSVLGAIWGVLLGGMMLAEHWWTRLRIQRLRNLPHLPVAVRAAFWLVCFGVAQMAQVPYAYTAENLGGLLRLYARMLGAD